MVNYRSQKFLGLLAPTQYARTTRLFPDFRVRVWLRETSVPSSMQVVWLLVGLVSFLVTNAGAQSCPANLNSRAQIVFVADRTIPLDAVLPIAFVDANLTFFREVLGFDDARIQQETQNAFQFFNERFGLNFSLSEPNELGQYIFQNATLQPFSRRPTSGVVTFNHWLVTGSTRARCYPVSVGGYFVSFTGEQTLRGTYGGEGGIQVTTSKNLEYGYTSISVPHRGPVVIQQWTPIPNEAVQIGIFVLFYELAHPSLGQGALQGFVQTERGTENGTSILRRAGTAVITFPPNVLSFN